MLQVVPSYLEVVLSRLEAEPRDLPTCARLGDRRGAAATWSRGGSPPAGVPLVNAYGLTETSTTPTTR